MKSLRRIIAIVLRDFVDFVLHQKKWWITTLLIIVAVLVGLILVNEQRAVRPLIYSRF